jgi:hypothetical protein
MRQSSRSAFGTHFIVLYLFSGCPGEWFFEAVLEAGGDSHCTYTLLSICIASKKQASGHPLNRRIVFIVI